MSSHLIFIIVDDATVNLVNKNFLLSHFISYLSFKN